MPSLRVHTIGGTVACNESEEGLRIPKKGRVEKLIRYECADASRAYFDAMHYSEAQSIIDSAQAKLIKNIYSTVQDVREMIAYDLKFGESLLLPVGTDNAPYYMHALAEGLTEEMLHERNVFGICTQNPAPNRPKGSRRRTIPEGDHVIRDLDNVLYLISTACNDMIDPHTRQGRIGLFNGGRLDAGRGLVKLQTGGDRAIQSRFQAIAMPSSGNIADAYSPNPPTWSVTQYGNHCDKPRGKNEMPQYQDGIQSEILDPTGHYENLSNSVWGQINDQGGQRDPQKLFGVVCQAPGAANLSEDPQDLLHLHRAAMHGLAAKTPVPIVVIADPLQPHFDAPFIRPSKYGGDFSRTREILDEIATNDASFNSENTPVIYGGAMARPEAKMEISRIVYRAAHVKNLKGIHFLRYVQRCLKEYENFIKTGQNKI